MIRILAENIAHIDLALFQLIFSRNGKYFRDRFFRLVTRSGDARAYFIIGTAILLLGGRCGENMVLASVAAFGFELLVYKGLKLIFRRSRPFDSHREITSLVAAPDRYSFPSGHTAAAFVSASLLAVSAPALYLPAFGWATLIGISRIYLGVHYPSDVLAGLALGLLSAHVGLVLFF